MNSRGKQAVWSGIIVACVSAFSIGPKAHAEDRAVVAAPAHIDVGVQEACGRADGSFWLINTGDGTARITSAKTSCGCTTIKNFAPFTLAAGDAKELRFSIKSPSTPGDWKTAAVTIGIEDQPVLAVPIRITAGDEYTPITEPVRLGAESPLRFAPDSITIDDTPAGELSRRTVWLINTGDAAMKLASLKTGCGCIKHQGFEPTTLQPGEAMPIELHISAPKITGEEKHTSVTVLADDVRYTLPVNTKAAHPHYVKALEYRAASKVDDVDSLRALLAGDSRIWFGERKGAGSLRTLDGKGPWAEWDDAFKSRLRYESHSIDGNAITFVVRELNDYMSMLDRLPGRYTITYWFDADDRIEGTLIGRLPQSEAAKQADRLPEFLTWADADYAEDILELMPEGRIEPGRENAIRWRALLKAWRASIAPKKTTDAGGN